jgi:hypothetical protein
MLLSGLLKLKGRRLTAEQVRQDIRAIFRGIEVLPQSLYGLFVAGPATVLYAYQKLLQLAGRRPEDAFPQGTWQFYVEFCLREDTARHVNETLGFQREVATAQDVSAAPDMVSEAAAWVCAGQALIYDYDALLAQDWRERVMVRLLDEALASLEGADQLNYAAQKVWSRQRPYHRPDGEHSYLAHRAALFETFIESHLEALPKRLRDAVLAGYEERAQEELPAYQEQMTILAALEPGRYQERKTSIAPWRVGVAFVRQGRTYFIPGCERDEHGSPLCYPDPLDSTGARVSEPFPLYADSDGGLCDAEGRSLKVRRDGTVWNPVLNRAVGCLRPPAPSRVKGWLSEILSSSPDGPMPTLDLRLVESPRSQQSQLRERLDDAARRALGTLRQAPIVINWDLHTRAVPLALSRRGRRGVGDHALTIIRADGSMIFDQSHIFFDGMWGMAVSEILTDSATHWYRRLLGTAAKSQRVRLRPLALQTPPEIDELTKPYRVRAEAVAESRGVDMQRMKRLRNWLKGRGVALTVNDLLLLYRSFHAARYQLSSRARAALREARKTTTTVESDKLFELIDATLERFRETNPSLLIPMDAGNVSPRERLYPTTFRNPFPELLTLFEATQGRYLRYLKKTNGDTWRDFDRERRELLAYLKAFGEVLYAIKAVTMRGESFNTATIRLLGHLPTSMQHVLDQIPQQIGVLNEILKGNEVFSNVGRVAKESTLSRFTSAKDDGEAKELVWGVMSDSDGTMVISLRDFRPFVAPLIRQDQASLADLLAQDYLDSYVSGLNRFMGELGTLVLARAEPRA